MISSVSLKVGNRSHKLKLSTRAQFTLEKEHSGKPINEILQIFLDGSKGVSMVVALVKACANDGAGFVDPVGVNDGPFAEDAALDLIEAAGGASAVVPKLSEAITAAFPQPEAPKDGEEAGNDKADQTE